MKKTLLITTIIMATMSCTDKNPFLSEWDTPYGIPDFTKIQEKHYIPAIQAGIRQQEAEIEAIITNTDAPTFSKCHSTYTRIDSAVPNFVLYFATTTLGNYRR